MSDKPHDFIDQYQAWVRQGLEAWSRQFDPKAGPEGATVPPPDIAARLFAGLGGYGEWMRSMAGGEGPGAALDGGLPPFGHVPGGSAEFDAWARAAKDMLSLPAFGLTREQQEEQQALLKAWIEYMEHYQRYRTLLQGVHERANAALREQAPPTDAESMRSVYDRWVNLAEESYAEAALSEEFREVYASLVNAQMRVKLLQQRQVERMAVQAGMPTRKEVDSLGERLQAARRELAHMRGLAAEVESLKAEVAALRGTKKPAAKRATKPKDRRP
ncbi:poly(R)-hydroxyalkanoic acid synthase subunit PhaE [Luteibacter yeojuensis]|uniref:Poly(3-hydroxyalkanoate) polymerase subunit PhaE n=1 Tax=Luteibacter yeojuensis TaxID=345309 RepID=A0A7X5TP34_9GAMM|nr:poly(R)-hydroxyalkanoic acid synthase subunit PhaE [Luteibacter yeojuensis]NID15076.1 pha synthase subunit protein [Luteibacter yeojuensis]